MNSKRDGSVHALALRDFFFATGGGELRTAFDRLAEASSASAPDVRDWQGEEFVFNRLFVGPGALKAPPYASVYLDPEATLMGETTLFVRSVYAVVGLVSPWKNVVPDDHLGLELDAVAAMTAGLERGGDQGLAALRAYFLAEHMAAWVPRFARAVREHAGDAPALGFAARVLEDWLAVESEAARAVLAKTITNNDGGGHEAQTN